MPSHVSRIDRIAFPKKPDTNIFISNLPLSTDVIPPNTESSAATIAIARYPEYVYDITGRVMPNYSPNNTS